MPGKSDNANGNAGSTPIEPIDIPLTQPAKSALQAETQWHQKPLVWAALAITLLLALAVIFVLPKLVSPAAVAPAAIQVAPTPVLETPFQDAQLGKARRQSQDTLNQLLEKQRFLEQKKVDLWAGEEFSSALNQAAEGDQFYRNREFTEAQQHYATSLQKLSELEQRIEPLMANTLKSGVASLLAEDAANALKAFELVLAVEPDNQDAIAGKQRADKLDQVRALVDKAEAERQSGDLQQAQQTYREATALDSHHVGAREGLQSISRQIADINFNSAMSKGYTELDADNFSAAQKAFRAALKVRPEDSAALAALKQASNRAEQQQIQVLINNANQYESREQWRQASEVYQQLLAKDASLVTAKVGQLRSGIRAKLDSDIQKILDSPLRLSSESVYQHGQQLLQDAKGIDNPGARLSGQIAGLTKTLAEARSRYPVILQSDGKTSVTLLKQGSLEPFSSRKIMLVPGNYVATGVREGYRDVRVEFQVTSAGLSSPVTVICREPL